MVYRVMVFNDIMIAHKIIGCVCGVVFSDWFTTKREFEVLRLKCICVIP